MISPNFIPIILVKQKKYYSLLVEAKAFDQKSAVKLSDIGIFEDRILKNMLRRKIIYKTLDNHYYVK